MKILFVVMLAITSFSTLATSPTTASARLESPALKSLKAEVKFKDLGKEIKVMARVSGLSPGAVHGIHIHEIGECKGPDFKSAAGHFNPGSHAHAGPGAKEKHFGDFGNIVANDQGVGEKEVIIKKEKGAGLENIIGKAMIIHAKADDLSSQPAGNAGERIACGIIKGQG